MRVKLLKRRRQLGLQENVPVDRKSQRLRSGAGTCVQVDSLRQESKCGADAERGVVEVQFAESGTRTKQSCQQRVEPCEVLRASDFFEMLRQNARCLSEMVRLQPSLVTVAKPVRSRGKRSAVNCVCERLVSKRL